MIEPAGEFRLYETEDGRTRVECRVVDDTLWLTQSGMADLLFQTTKQYVAKHLKATIHRWLWPDFFKNHDTSVAKAKKAIADYKKAVGPSEGLAELMVFYCECAIGFANEAGLDDDAYYDALVRMFEQALKTVMPLPEAQREPFLDRLDHVRTSDRNISGWVADEFNEFWHRAGLAADE